MRIIKSLLRESFSLLIEALIVEKLNFHFVDVNFHPLLTPRHVPRFNWNIKSNMQNLFVMLMQIYCICCTLLNIIIPQAEY